MKRIFVFALALVMMVSLCACGGKKTYRDVRWGMTQAEIKKLEANRGNSIITESENEISYTIGDLPTGNSNDVCIYYFDGKNGTLSSFVLGNAENGEDFFWALVPEIVDIYGDGTYDIQDDVLVVTATGKWSNEYETIEATLFRSSIRNTGMFVFTYTGD